MGGQYHTAVHRVNLDPMVGSGWEGEMSVLEALLRIGGKGAVVTLTRGCVRQGGGVVSVLACSDRWD